MPNVSGVTLISTEKLDKLIAERDEARAHIAALELALSVAHIHVVAKPGCWACEVLGMPAK